MSTVWRSNIPGTQISTHLPLGGGITGSAGGGPVERARCQPQLLLDPMNEAHMGEVESVMHSAEGWAHN